MYRHWTPVVDTATELEYHHDSETPDTTDHTVVVRAERDPPHTTTDCCWTLALVVDGDRVHDFAESHGDPASPGPAVALPAPRKADVRRFAAWWVRTTPTPVAALARLAPTADVDHTLSSVTDRLTTETFDGQTRSQR